MTKKAYFKLLLISAILPLFIACQQENDEPASAPSTQDAAKVVEESLAKSSGGMAEEIAKINEAIQAKDLGNLDLECGVPLDTTFNYFLSGDATGAWTRYWNLLLNCPAGTPPFLEVNTTYEGNFSGSFVSQNREGNRSWTWSNLGPEGEFLYMNGSGSHSGNRNFNGPGQNGFSWTFDGEWNEVAISKETHIIDSGDGSFTLVFTGPQGNVFTFEGTVVFNGDQMATVTVNGEVYEVELG